MFKRNVRWAIAAALILSWVVAVPVFAGVGTANGWYEGEEIYYIAGGVEAGVTERGENQIYLIGGDRVWQAQVVLFIPGEPGYSPHWNANLVNTTPWTTVAERAA